ncbi:hypothetical protein BJ742DRAFT_775137 [Cladochytrium replicatum]|nr:hypothetical protein BJ742DRAFT_775137 [Cladochytrium replicatum]
MDRKVPFNGPRAPRFQLLPPIEANAHVGPTSYEVDAITTLSTITATKPASKRGVWITTAERFTHKVTKSPGANEYTLPTFVDLLSTRVSSRAEYNLPGHLDAHLKQTHSYNPAPGTYDVNYAVGRQIANDDRFSLLKSVRLKQRDILTKTQRKELKKLLEKDDLFTDKRACRRMAHLSLYYP